jgi:hypothetical protein
MDYRSITAMALRLSGVLILVNTVPSVPSFVYGFVSDDRASTGSAALLSMVSVAIPLIIALALIYFPSRVSKSLQGVEPSAEQRESTARIGEIAFISLGIYLVASALFDSAYYVVKIWLLHRDAAEHDFQERVPLAYDTIAGLVSCGLQVVIGLVLMFSARGLYGLIRRLRDTRSKV